jgi:hypothetical protein
MTSIEFKFDPTPKNLAVGAADQISTNVFDAGSAKKLFEGYPVKPMKLNGMFKITAGTGALSIRVRFVGADNAALTANPVILADTGVVLLDTDGTALAIGDVLLLALTVQGQQIAKQFYGVIYTMGTADEDGEVTAVLCETPQTWMAARKAAVP